MTTRLLLIVCLLGCGACDRDDALVSRTIELGAFSQVEVLSDLEMVFVESDRAALEVRGPESGVEPVAAEVIAGVLRITTGERGRWLSPKRARPTLTLYAPPLYRITLGDGARLSSGGPIGSADFGVVFTGKLCEADLDLAGGTFYYWTSSFTGGRLTLRGETETLLLYNFGITGVEARGLSARRAEVVNGSRGAVSIRVRDTLTYTISGAGDLRLVGEAVTRLSAPVSGAGRLVRE